MKFVIRIFVNGILTNSNENFILSACVRQALIEAVAHQTIKLESVILCT